MLNHGWMDVKSWWYDIFGERSTFNVGFDWLKGCSVECITSISTQEVCDADSHREGREIAVVGHISRKIHLSVGYRNGYYDFVLREYRPFHQYSPL
jgi:hypothetical protein